MTAQDEWKKQADEYVQRQICRVAPYKHALCKAVDEEKLRPRPRPTVEEPVQRQTVAAREPNRELLESLLLAFTGEHGLGADWIQKPSSRALLEYVSPSAAMIAMQTDVSSACPARPVPGPALVEPRRIIVSSFREAAVKGCHAEVFASMKRHELPPEEAPSKAPWYCVSPKKAQRKQRRPEDWVTRVDKKQAKRRARQKPATLPSNAFELLNEVVDSAGQSVAAVEHSIALSPKRVTKRRKTAPRAQPTASMVQNPFQLLPVEV